MNLLCLKWLNLFFCCGVLSENKNESVDFLIRDISSIIDKVLPYFLNYPLRGTKHLDFLSFIIINKKEHLLEEGLFKLFTISKTMNSYRKFIGENYYSPSLTVIGNINYIPLNGHYVNGFIAGDGCLSLTLINKNFCKMSLQISQHINNKLLLLDIANYFESSKKVYKHDKNSLQVTLNGIKL
jgi:LAGLIDADG endonuclease